MALVSVAVTWFGTPEMTLFFGLLQIAQALPDGNLVSGVSGQISVDSATGQELANYGGKVYHYNNLFSTATAMVDFFTQSDETWIEMIKINVFCNNSDHMSNWIPEGEGDFLHTAYCRLDKEGKVVENGIFDVQRRKEYTMDGGEWNTTPYSKVITKEHYGSDEEYIMRQAENIKEYLNPVNNQRKEKK